MNQRAYFQLIFAILFAVPLTGAGIDLISPSLPQMQIIFNVSSAEIKHLIGVYLVGYSIGVTVFGIWSDHVGRRNLYMLGLIIYCVSSALCLFTKSISILISLRLFQGFGIGAVGVLSRAIFKDCFSGDQLRRVIAFFTTAWSTGPIVAPFIGGFIQSYLSWQYDFVLFFILGCLSIFLFWMFVPETHHDHHVFDFIKFKNNVLEIISNSYFLLIMLGLFVGYTFIILFNVVGPFIIQDKLNYSPKTFGYVALIMGLAYFFGTLSYGFLQKKIKLQVLMHIAMLLLTAASLVLLLVGFGGLSLFNLSVPIFIMLFSIGYIMPPGFAAALGMFPDKVGTTSAIMGFSVSFFAGLSSVLASYLNLNTLLPTALSYAACTILLWVSYYYGMRSRIN